MYYFESELQSILRYVTTLISRKEYSRVLGFLQNNQLYAHIKAAPASKSDPLKPKKGEVGREVVFLKRLSSFRKL